MGTDAARRSQSARPIQAILLVSAFPLFLGTLLADWAYAGSYVVQWTNFASWLNLGALVFLGPALLWAIVSNMRRDRLRSPRSRIFIVLLVVTFGLGFTNALIHAKDAWAAMPTGLLLSLLCVLFMLATLFSFYALDRGVRG